MPSSIALETLETCVVPIVRLKVEEPRKTIETAVHLLKTGKLLALPTDTVYGLAASAKNRDACLQLYHVKGRQHAKPLAISVGRVDDVYKWGEVPFSDELLNALLPGPVTLLLKPKQGQLLPLPEDPELVGIRVPDHDFPRAVANELGFPIALTSANISGEPSSLDPLEFKSIWPKLSAVFDGGIIENNDEVQYIVRTYFVWNNIIMTFSQASRSGSTVIDLSKKGYFKIIRAGVGFSNTKQLLLDHGLEEQS
ncbi:hypothetical protein B566_EDAN009986 [Ephemera danica]|nr:hypothetical protein B566_EDAN009986 [Ephemera danica]